MRLQAGIMVIEATRVERQWRGIDCIASKMKQQKRRLNKQKIINNHKLIQITFTATRFLNYLQGLYILITNSKKIPHPSALNLIK